MIDSRLGNFIFGLGFAPLFLQELCMKTKNERLNQIGQAFKSKIKKDTVDEGYFQINQVSFQQNFKSLLDHYKKDNSLKLDSSAIAK